MEKDKHTTLTELSDSDFQIAEGQPNLIGWEVKNETGTYIGEVEELLFDPQTSAVRYLIVDLTDNGMNMDDKSVMIPLGIAHLHISDDEVVLPGLHLDQYQALPDYDQAELSPELEREIRAIIGSPAALRLEDTVTELDQRNFYEHHHFDRGRFYQRGGPNAAALSGETERTEERILIHDLVQRSRNEYHTENETQGLNPSQQRVENTDDLEDFPGHS